MFPEIKKGIGGGLVAIIICVVIGSLIAQATSHGPGHGHADGDHGHAEETKAAEGGEKAAEGGEKAAEGGEAKKEGGEAK